MWPLALHQPIKNLSQVRYHKHVAVFSYKCISKERLLLKSFSIIDFDYDLIVIKFFNSHTVGKAVAQPLDFEIDFARNPISGSAALLFFIILKLNQKACRKFPWYQKNLISKSAFYKPIHI